MKIFLDSANISKLNQYVPAYGLDGFTCNPTICAKDNADMAELFKTLPDSTAFYQVIAEDYAGILADAKKIREYRPNAIIKVPVTADGLRAIKTLTSQGIPVLATAIYTTLQALLAAQAGAQFVAPYTNRISDNGNDGVRVVLEIVEAIERQELDCQVVAASFKNLGQINDLLVGGCHCVTITLDLFEKMIDNNLTINAVKEFANHWEKQYQKSTI